MRIARTAWALGVVIASLAASSAHAASISEFAVSGAPFGIAAGPDRALWFAENDLYRTGWIGRITTSGKVREFKLPGAFNQPQFIAIGSDGALWFTDASSNTIGRITTAGKTTKFAIPTRYGHPISIAAGSDGALWFTEYPEEIGRISSSGAIQEFKLADLSLPQGIAAGPDGALWFTYRTVGAIGRITTSGAIQQFKLANGTWAQGIAAGPDGALWFTEDMSGRIGRITTSGTVTQFATPTRGSEPFAIAAGSDRALWFTESGDVNKIGRITTAGRFEEFTTPASASGRSIFQTPMGIAAGPDGALWFSDSSSGEIGRITTSVAAPRNPAGEARLSFSCDRTAVATNCTVGVRGLAGATRVTARLIGAARLSVAGSSRPHGASTRISLHAPGRLRGGTYSLNVAVYGHATETTLETPVEVDT
jgi:streptogramin lyase